MRSLAGNPVAPEFIKTSRADHRSADGPFFLDRLVGLKSQSVATKRGNLSSPLLSSPFLFPFPRKTKLIEREREGVNFYSTWLKIVVNSFLSSREISKHSFFFRSTYHFLFSSFEYRFEYRGWEFVEERRGMKF